MVTILLSTYNRPLFLQRILNYLNQNKTSFPILLGDASEGENLIINKKLVQEYSNHLNIKHLIFDSKSDLFEVVYPCLEQVSTRYVVYQCDDDFIIPETIETLVNFLKVNISYSAAYGKEIYFSTASGGPYSNSIRTGPLKMVDFSIEGACAEERVKLRMSQNTRIQAPKLSCSVMVTSIAVNIFKEILSLGLNHSYNEDMISKMVLLSGNIKLIDKLYLARQLHPSNSASRAHGRYVPIITQSKTGMSYKPMKDLMSEQKSVNPPDFFDQLTDHFFPEQYERMSNCLTNELVRQDKIDVEEARRIIKHWEWFFLAKNMMPKFYEHRGGDYLPKKVTLNKKSKLMQLRKIVKQIPGAKNVWERFSGGEMSLASLLHESSPYHADFMPIYQAIIPPPNDFNNERLSPS